MQYYLDQDVHAKRGVVDQARAQLKERLEYLQSDLAATWARMSSLEGQPTALETPPGTINAQQTEAIALQRREAAAEQAKRAPERPGTAQFWPGAQPSTALTTAESS